MTDARICPNCESKLYFMPDGRSLYCERCNYRQEVPSENRPSAIDIIDLIKTLAFLANRPVASQTATNMRDFLARGVAAAKVGDREEAFYYLERLLYMNPDDETKMRAWFWLSEIVDDFEQKRLCLEQVLVIDPHHPTARRGMAIVEGRIKKDEIINPNTVQATVSDTPLEAQAEEFRCPHCAARIQYNPTTGDSLTCDFCSYTQQVTTASTTQETQFGQGPFEQDFIAAMATAKGHLSPVNMRSFQCQGCAVSFVLSPEAVSLTCPYCDSVYVAETAETNEIMPPNALIPFAVTKDDARQALRHWFKQHNIQRARVAPLVGLYLPVWTFDIGGSLRWQGQVSEHDTLVTASGVKVIFHDDVLVPAGHRLPTALAEKALRQYDLSQLVGYEMGYLADWPAERYDIPLGNAAIQARKQALTYWRRNKYELTGRLDVTHLRIRTSNMMVESFKLIFLPMWITHYQQEEQNYDVTINGQNKRVYGQRQQNVIGRFVAWLKGE